MSVTERSYQTISADEVAPTSWMRIGQGLHRVDVEFSASASASVTPKQTSNPMNTSATHAVEKDGSAVVLTGSGSFMVHGPCYVGAIVSGLSGVENIKFFSNYQGSE